MEQLILHLFGDYIIQTDWMAKHKTSRAFVAFIHALTYSLPFLLLQPSWMAFMVILWTHFLIDHFRLVRYVMFAKNWINEPHIKWEDYQVTGYHKDVPPHIAFWLMVLADNTIHLAINYSALRWL